MGLDSKKIYMIIPQFDNTGYVDQMVSRGYLNAVGRLGGHGNIDSWMNHIGESLPQGRMLLTPEKLMHDFTPNLETLTPEYMISDITKGKKLPKWGSPEIEKGLQDEVSRVEEAIKNGL